jgi:methylglutaconyl-CoA hydratase
MSSVPDQKQVLLSSLDRKGVLTLTLNRPEKGNAITPEMANHLKVELVKASINPRVKVVKLTGAGNSFCTGIDLHAMNDVVQTQSAEKIGAFMTPYLEMLEVMDNFRKPIITVAQNNAIGLGSTLLLLSDRVITTPGIRVGYPEKYFGLKPWISALYTMRILGLQKTLGYFRAEKFEEGINPMKEGWLNAATTEREIDGLANLLIGRTLALQEDYRNKEKRPRVALPKHASQEGDYGSMAEALVNAYSQDKEEFKRVAIEGITQEMLDPKVRQAIGEYVSKIDRSKAPLEPNVLTMVIPRRTQALTPKKPIEPRPRDGRSGDGPDQQRLF